MVTWGHVASQKLNISYSTKHVTTKLNRTVAYNENNSPMISHDHVVTWSHAINWKLNISSSKKSVITKPCRVVTSDEGNSPIVSDDSLTTKSCEVTWGHVINKKPNFLLCTTHVTTKLGIDEDLWWGELTHDVTWLCDQVVTEVTWQVKNKISPPQGR